MNFYPTEPSAGATANGSDKHLASITLGDKLIRAFFSQYFVGEVGFEA